MPRPNKRRLVNREPKFTEFLPVQEKQTGNTFLVMSVEEYETLRLIDYMGMTQQECASQMEVSRATVQALYTQARMKTARFLVEGQGLKIGGGNYEVCGSNGKDRAFSEEMNQKGEQNMKIAVTYENGQVFQHFGHTEKFKVYDVEDGKIVSTEIVDTNGQGHGALAGFLFGGGVDVLICGGIGGGARNALAEAGIELYPGAAGDADEQVASFLAGKLVYDPNTMCNHHGEGHTCGDHEDGHSCGEHGEGHGCGHHN